MAAVLGGVVFFSLNPSKKEWDVLSEKEKATLHRILAHWETWVPQKKADGSAPLITFPEIYAGLGVEETRFLDRVRAVKPSSKEVEANVSFKRIDDQWVEKQGVRSKINTQYLPENVYAAYLSMMEAMQRDLGKRLYVDSGYRSPAYQLYLFLFYTPEHHYSLKETNQWVAFPGHSEHGNPSIQAIDFINEKGINGDDDGQVVEDFERLPEYEWLQKNAAGFGFRISYPRGNKTGTTFEPWHWSYCGESCE